MMYDTLLARSFSKHEQKRLGYGALVGCFVIALSLCTVFKPYLGPLPTLNLQLTIGAGQILQIVNDTRSSVLTAKDLEDAETITKSIQIKNDTRGTQTAKDPEFLVTEKPVVKDTNSSPQILNQTVMMENALIINDTSSSQQTPRDVDAVPNNKFDHICNSTKTSDVCDIKGDIRIDGKSSTVFIVSSEADILTAVNTSWSVRPYARKFDQVAMSNTREWSLKLVPSSQGIPQCTRNHRAPGILFSSGGYSGNHFHSFTDIILPLFSTARPFNGDVEFLVSNNYPRWIAKFETLLRALSRYEFVDIDKEKDIHCFTSMIVGLKRQSDKELNVDPTISGYSMKDFRQFLRSLYLLKKSNATKIKDGGKKRPRLLIISRKRSRAFTHVGEIARMAKGLGYKVVVDEPDANLSRFAHIMNSCDAVMGVHGAGLTNILFLPENAVLIQVVPFGGAEWISRAYFEEPSKDMNVRYLKYTIRLEESTLMQQYPADHVVLRDPTVIRKQGWLTFKSIYLDKQHVNLDLNRFRPTLLKALELLRN